MNIQPTEDETCAEAEYQAQLDHDQWLHDEAEREAYQEHADDMFSCDDESVF